MANVYKTRIDIKNTRPSFKPTFVQYDHARIEIELLDNAQYYDLSTASRVEVTHVRPDNEVIIQPAEIVSNGDKHIIRYEYLGSEMDVLGTVKTSLAVFDENDNKVSSHTFDVVIEKDLRGEFSNPAQPRFDLIETMRIDIEELKRNGGGGIGLQGPKGDPFTFEDFTQSQIELLRGPQGLQGERGPKGEPGEGVALPLTRNQLDFYTRIPATINLFNKNSSSITRNGFYNLSGVFTLNVVPGQDWMLNYGGTGFIPVKPNTTYFTTMKPYLAYWTTSKTFISGVDIQLNATSHVFTTPANCYFVTFGMWLPEINSHVLVEGNTAPTGLLSPYEMYKDESVIIDVRQVQSELYGLKWNAMGDSISTTDYSTTNYQYILRDKHNMLARNYGISSNCIAASASRPNPMVERYVNMDNDADFITIMGGGNDCAIGNPIGTISDTSTSTFMGALNVLCAGLIAKYPGKRIGFITPIPASVPEAANLQSYADAMIAVCAKYSIPVLDLFRNSGLYPHNSTINSTLYVGDGMHPSPSGHEILARKIESFLKTL